MGFFIRALGSDGVSEDYGDDAPPTVARLTDRRDCSVFGNRLRGGSRSTKSLSLSPSLESEHRVLPLLPKGKWCVTRDVGALISKEGGNSDRESVR